MVMAKILRSMEEISQQQVVILQPVSAADLEAQEGLLLSVVAL